METKTILSVIEELIQKTMKERGEALKDKDKLAVVDNKLKIYRLIKAELIKNNDKKDYTLTEEQEIKTLIKMKEEREKYEGIYRKAKRNELADTLKNEISIISEFIPAQPSDEEIRDFTSQTIDKYLSEQDAGYQLSKKDMANIMPMIKAKYPNVNGKIVNQVLSEKIN